MQSAQSVESVLGQSTGAADAVTVPGLEFPRFFTRDGVDPFDAVEWETRAAVIGDEKGHVVFEQRDVEIPKSWSQLATNVVVSKYFRGTVGTPERERSVRQLIGRVVDTITGWGARRQYFASEDDLQAFRDELKHLLLYQKVAFNSPVWFNVRRRGAPAVLGVLHQLRGGHDGVDPRPSPRPRACSSSTARARARTCRASARRRSCSRAAARPRARCRS